MTPIPIQRLDLLIHCFEVWDHSGEIQARFSNVTLAARTVQDNPTHYARVVSPHGELDLRDCQDLLNRPPAHNFTHKDFTL